MLNSLDDQYTTLYKYVEQYQYPKRFLVLLNGQIYTIFDYFDKKLYNLQPYFDSKDLVMIYFESFFDNINEYKQWILKTQKQEKYKKLRRAVDANQDLASYATQDIINYYHQKYGQDKQFDDFLLNMVDIIYFDNERDDIYKLLQLYQRAKNIILLNDLYTTNDYAQVEFENQLKNKEVVDQVNVFKNKFDDLLYINYDTKSLVEEYIDWIINTNQNLLSDLQIYQNLISNQSISTDINYNKLKISPLIVESYTKIYHPLFNNNIITPDDGYELFNNAVVSPTSPFIIYKNNEGVQIYKIYNQTLNDNIVKQVDNNTIYFNIIVDNQTICYINYNLLKNEMSFQFTQFLTKNINLQTYIDKIIPNLKIEEVQEDVIFEQTLKGDYTLTGEFNIWNVEMNEVELTNIVMNDNIVNKSFYVNDNIKNLTKSYVPLVYIPLLSNQLLSIKLTQNYYNSDKNVKYVDNNTYQNVQLKKPNKSLLPFITVHFKNVYNYNGLVTILKMLIDKSVSIDTNDFSFGFGLNDLLYQLEVKELNIDENLKLLKDIAPNAFVEGYANFCTKRPRPIDKQDINNYINNKIKEYGLKGENKANFIKFAVLQFKTEDDTINLVCDHPTDMFPYLKSTEKEVLMKNLDKSIYDSLPCCKKLPPKEKKVKQEQSHIISQTFINVPSATGELDKKIKNILDRYNTSDNNFVRFGVPQEPTSFLHCLCVATEDSGYKNTSDKSSYVNLLLIKIANQTHFGLLKQELYDLNVEFIKDKMLSGEFLDPSLYYRAFEEYFNVNIYVFSDTTILDVPRHNVFHSRPVRQNRKTVLIYKNVNQYKVYQCELIVNKVTYNMLIYNQDMSQFCHTLLQNYMNTLTFNVINNNMTVYSNLYYYADFLSLLQINKKSMTQYIDANGKLRGLTFDVGQEKMTMLTLPSQPENLRTSNKIMYVKLQTALKVFEPQQPTSMVKTNDNIVGLWYKIFDLEQGVYIPVISQDNKLDIKQGLIHPLIVNDTHYNVSHYYQLKKILNFLLQIITWMYFIFINNNVNEFFKQFVVMYDTVNDEAYQNILTIPRKLPTLTSIDDVFTYIKDYLPVVDNKIIIYGKNLYDGIKHQLQLITLTNTKPNFVLNNYYQYITDYQKQYNTLIFLNEQNLTSWIAQHQWKHDLQILHNLYNQTYIYPYIYSDINGNIYIIQNVESGSYEQATYLSYYWSQHKINLGYHGLVKDNHCKPSIYKTLFVAQYDKTLTHLELVQTGSDDCKIVDYQYKDVVDKKKTSYAALLTLF
jgi:hypothetical protein